jgi:hypothetical protein
MKTKDIYSSSIAYAAVEGAGIKQKMFNPRTCETFSISQYEVESLKTKAYNAALVCVDNLYSLCDQQRYDIAIAVCMTVINHEVSLMAERARKTEEIVKSFTEFLTNELSKETFDLAKAYEEIAKLKESNSL